jgi:hypothetical protein
LTRAASLVTSMTFAALLCSPFPALSQTAPALGASQSFAVLGGSAVTVAGVAATVISGDVGSSPTPSVTGFPPGQVAPGFTLYTTNAIQVQNAQGVNTAAYNSLASGVINPCGPALSAPADSLGGRTLGPGVYCLGAGDLTGTLTLNGAGVYVFKTASSLTTAGASNIVLGPGVSSCDIYWQVTSSATLGAASTFRGNIFALAGIGLGTTANVIGRTWTKTAVTMDGGNTVGGCSVAPVAPNAPTIGKGFSPFTVVPGATSVLTITLTNSDPTVATLTAAFTDNLPAGVVIAATPNAATTCGGGGALSAAAGSSSITLAAGRTIAAGGTCTVTVNVTASTAGVYINNLPAGSLQTSNGNNALAALATLTVVAAVPSLPPTLGKGFSPFSIVAGGTSTLTITLSNPDPEPATITAALVDTLPAGVTIAATPNARTTCAGSGVVGADPGGSTVTLHPTGRIPGATGATPGICTVTVDVTAAVPGNYLNTLPANALQTDHGSNVVPATTTLTVVPVPLPPPVPTLSEWAVIMLAGLLGLAGFGAIRRRPAR